MLHGHDILSFPFICKAWSCTVAFMGLDASESKASLQFLSVTIPRLISCYRLMMLVLPMFETVQEFSRSYEQQAVKSGHCRFDTGQSSRPSKANTHSARCLTLEADVMSASLPAFAINRQHPALLYQMQDLADQTCYGEQCPSGPQLQQCSACVLQAGPMLEMLVSAGGFSRCQPSLNEVHAAKHSLWPSTLPSDGPAASSLHFKFQALIREWPLQCCSTLD